MQITPVGDSALRVSFGVGSQVDPVVNRQVHALAHALDGAAIRARPPGLGEAVPGYAALLVYYDPLLGDAAQIEAFIRSVMPFSSSAENLGGKLVEVPVIYGGEGGPDLDFVAQHSGLSAAEVIRRHAAPEYPVYLMGFTPGFPYLGGLDPSIAAPRLPSPRQNVPAGSVGIAGEQTGIYPLNSPGGWRIIGHTPLVLFDPSRSEPFWIHPGDRVRFIPQEPPASG